MNPTFASADENSKVACFNKEVRGTGSMTRIEGIGH